MLRFVALSAFLCTAGFALAQPRETLSLDGPWKVTLGNTPVPDAASADFDDHSWGSLTVPSAFNAGKNDWRNLSDVWYRRHFRLGGKDKDKVIYLTFDAVNTVAEVFVNGKSVGAHRGGYTRFTLDVSGAVRDGDNVVAVHVDNKNFKDCLPAEQRLFKLYGGLIRDVWLVKANPIHIDPTDFGADGVYVNSRNLEGRAEIRTLIRNTGAAEAVTLIQTIRDAGTKAVVAHSERSVAVSASNRTVEVGNLSVPHPKLWSPKAPNLYVLETELKKGDETLDRVDVRFGFDTLTRQGSTLLLNGSPILLRGFAKHEDTEASGGAITRPELDYEYRTLKQVGANFVRMAHYPHSQYELGLADENGLVVWAENGHISHLPPTDTGRQITREMVRQLYNHPSILLWSCGNETGKDVSTAMEYAKLIHEEDPNRYVTYADSYRLPVSDFPQLDIVSRNVYPAWYDNDAVDAALVWAGFVSENGFGASITTHTDYDKARRVVDKFEPEEFQTNNLETVCGTIFGPKATQVPLYAMWNFRDFADRKYKGLNTKGLITFAGMPKDAFYLFQTFLRPDLPVTHVVSSRYFVRPTQTVVKVYSNAASLMLRVNGTLQPIQRNGAYRTSSGLPVANVFAWAVTLGPGKNTILATDGKWHQDEAILTTEGPIKPGSLISDLRSSNSGNPAVFVDDAVKPESGFFSNFDGTGDNTFTILPAELKRAAWIATRRTSDPAMITDLSFTVGHGAVLAYVLETPDSAGASVLEGAGFARTGLHGVWRDNNLNRVQFDVFLKRLDPDQKVVIPGVKADYVVLLKPSR